MGDVENFGLEAGHGTFSWTQVVGSGGHGDSVEMDSSVAEDGVVVGWDVGLVRLDGSDVESVDVTVVER